MAKRDARRTNPVKSGVRASRSDASMVLPSMIPWASLKGRLLEECLYFLLDSLGARELQWRLGGTSGGAADQGRDIEALMPELAKDGGLDSRQWWIEAKGRTDTVEPEAVKQAAHNCFAYGEVEVLCIATNTQFSNPLHDWVGQWNRSHPRPKIRLWDRAILERMLMRHPSVVARLFASALTEQGRLEFVKARFWDHLVYAGTPELVRLWDARHGLSWSEMARVAVIAGEAANGDLAKRPWTAELPEQERLGLLMMAVAQAPQLLMRAESMGSARDPILATLAHLLIVNLLFMKHTAVARLVTNPWQFTSRTKEAPKGKASKVISELVVRMMIERASLELGDVCTRPCRRVLADPALLTERDAEPERYRQRFHPPAPRTEKDSLRENYRVLIERGDRPCHVGFPLDKEHNCPLMQIDEDNGGLDNTLAVLQRVAFARLGNQAPAKTKSNGL